MRALKAIWRCVDEYGLLVLGIGMIVAGLMSGCAAGSSSTITPAKSTAEQKTLTVTAPARHKRRLIVRVPAAPTTFVSVPEGGEDK